MFLKFLLNDQVNLRMPLFYASFFAKCGLFFRDWEVVLVLLRGSCTKEVTIGLSPS